MNSQPLIPPTGKPVKLANFDPGLNGGSNKEAAESELKKLQNRLAELQEIMYAQGKHALLVILQGMDTSGKDGAIKAVFESVNPIGVRVAAFKAPTALELSHDFLWRVHQQVPPKGYIGIFNRSHYEDVLIVRVNSLVRREVWEKRYEQINAFEKLLSESGTLVLKFFLHISKEEQKERLLARLNDPNKRWKFSMDDLPVRDHWDDYMRVYEDALTRCNTEHTPWHIVPSNRKWYRNLVITRTIVEAMGKLELRFPEPADGLEKIVIPD